MGNARSTLDWQLVPVRLLGAPMGSDPRNDETNKIHKTVPVFGISASEESRDETDGPSDASTVNRSPASILSPTPLSEAELPSVIEPGVVLFNKYRVLEEIGHGGMGSVWLVEHMRLGEKRALKVIHALVAADPRVRARFRQEAKILAKLKHPSAVIVHDTDIVGPVAFIDMEYLEGKTLRELLKPDKPLEIGTAIWVLKEVCEVLARAHTLGIVHRDLKPENIMIVRDQLSGTPQLKVLDFGIAKIVQEEGEGSGLTLHTEGTLGTPAYSSPEQNDIDPDTKNRLAIDRRSDIYSLGVILFEMLTVRAPSGEATPSCCTSMPGSILPASRWLHPSSPWHLRSKRSCGGASRRSRKIGLRPHSSSTMSSAEQWGRPAHIPGPDLRSRESLPPARARLPFSRAPSLDG